MGRFVNPVRVEPIVHPFMQYPPNPKIAISRNPNQIGHESVIPLRIAPAPRKISKPDTREEMSSVVFEIKRKENDYGSKESSTSAELQKGDEEKIEGKQLDKVGKETIGKDKYKDSVEVEVSRPGLRSASLRRKHV